MALTFSQSPRGRLFVPIALAFLVLFAIVGLVVYLTPHTTADLSISHVATWQSHTVFKSDTILVGRDKAEDNLYVLTTLHIDDRLRLPLFLKDFTSTLTTASGETLASSAVEKADLPSLYETFPAVKALATPPLARETQIDPGGSAEGMVLLHFPITQDDWNHRQSATLTVDLYHQDSQHITIPKSTPTAP